MLEILGPGIVGGLFLPILGALYAPSSDPSVSGIGAILLKFSPLFQRASNIFSNVIPPSKDIEPLARDAIDLHE